MQFLHSLGHDLYVACLTLLVAIWAVGMWWGWRTFRAAAPVARVLLALLWPLGVLIQRFAIVQALLAACLLGALVNPQPAQADSMARQGSDWVRLTARPCTNEKVLATITAAHLDPASFWAATASFGGTPYAACWTLVRGGAGLIYEDGDQGLIPQSDLKPAPDA